VFTSPCIVPSHGFVKFFGGGILIFNLISRTISTHLVAIRRYDKVFVNWSVKYIPLIQKSTVLYK
jgi:hypothetical protein